MPIRRVTISMPEPVATQVKKAAGKQSVSAWLTQLVEEHLDEAELERQWQAFYEQVAPKGASVRRANAIFARVTKPKRRHRAA